MSGAVIGKRVEQGDANTAEITGLARAAGYEVGAAVTATAPRDATFNLPSGTVAGLADAAESHDATVAVVDNELTPGQAHNLSERLPADVAVYDRRRLVLEVFERGAGTEAARLQVKLARLRYELPRLRADVRRDEATEVTRHDEEGKPIEDHKRRIDETRRKLRRVEDPTPKRMERRRTAGFDTVALAGYTNAGKTTLLRRLADDLSLDADGHPDESGEPNVANRLFETLGTTTRRASIAGRRVLLTDTVGFVSDLPHEFVASFESTVASARHADVVLLVVDATDDTAEIERKVAVAREQLADAEGTVVPVLNKADMTTGAELAAAGEPFESEPVEASATEGALAALRERLVAELPTEEATLSVPNSDAAMQFVSWCYDHAEVRDVDCGKAVEVRLRGKPSVVAEAERRAERHDTSPG
ncbi:GTPase HflX [Halobacteriales archaeon QH_7_66_36]|nr:MAG: GTPase HflX [Halobacteriales archaeon QH_7_66_36]